MNLVNLMGIIFAVFIMIFSMVFGNPNPGRMLDPHGALIVIGGTIACIGVAFSLPRAFSMVMIFFKGVIRTRVERDLNKVIIQDLMRFAEAYRSGNSDLENMVKKSSDHFLREAMQALLDDVLEPDELIRILHERNNTIYERYADDARMFAACGKYPPAMGLMGAVTGMIMLLGSLGQPGAEKTVGPNMSVALVATLYGIALANLFIIPIGEHLQEIAKRIKLKNLIIVEGVKHIQQKKNPVVLAEELNSFLLPSERLDWKAINK